MDELFNAITEGDLNKIVISDELIESRKFKKTPFMYACVYGKLDIVKYLVEAGCDVNADDWVSFSFG